MKFSHRIGMALMTALTLAALTTALAPPNAGAQPFYQANTSNGEPYTEALRFTNTASGVSSFQLTNSVIQITNGSLTVTSAPVALRNGGVSLWVSFAVTNALLTNIVSEWQFSPDGVNWGDEVLTWRAGGSAFAVGKYTARTNIPRDVAGNMRYMRLWKVHATNGANTVGNIFLTNSQLPFVAQTFP